MNQRNDNKIEPFQNLSFAESQALKEKLPPVTKERPFRSFRKDIKRIIWPKAKKAWKWYAFTLLFLVVFAVLFFLITVFFTNIWNSLGIKL
ncbi:preprotein translocase subunit SecE [Mycoplasma miroungirhinis]|uniref:Preprotein translocase subunit SecE n=1 Tax=Mycoplasma miroungirhinis TaxID=754516 RepID=A0A6M4JAD8_9MOLU|nr:preprotein translocase subunit SecE [Mycoplasma miroungirhinis]QJR43870.1 preprotein translocase subunit SecE [Mycoplasma miroungirhinis]